MNLQIAVDVADTKRILEIASQIHDVIDIYEVGTPVIMKEGMVPVRELKNAYPNLCVLADTKIMDGGALECKDVCEAGRILLQFLPLRMMKRFWKFAKLPMPIIVKSWRI